MGSMLNAGDQLNSVNNVAYQVVRLLGAGGQGEVYEVSAGGKGYALKWYYERTATNEQRTIIDNLISKGTPDGKFLWPKDKIEKNNTFGYIMDLRPQKFKSIIDLMKRKTEPTFSTLCMAGINVADGYHKLHASGYCYRDISFGNLFFDPDNGDVLICDNDNVTVNGTRDCSIYGTQRFMAPEIVRGEQPPSTDTDLFSLAVLLFYMFMIHHPLEGAIESNIKCFDMAAMNMIYGKNPIFIWDPVNDSNRPVAGYQDNAIVFWDLYPQALKDVFTTAFTEGLANPRKRILEYQWKDALIQLKNSIIYCPACQSENFYDIQKVKNGVEHICWNCKRAISLPPRMKIGNSLIMLNRSSKIYSHHVEGNYDMATAVGEVNQHPQDPSKWGIRNVSKGIWTYIKKDGASMTVENGKNAPLSAGAKINFGSRVGEIKTI